MPRDKTRTPRVNLTTLLGIALIILTFFGALAWFSTDDNTVTIYVAQQDIPARREVTDSMVTAQDVDKDALAPGAIRDPAQIVGRYTIDAIYQDEAFTSQRLATDATRSAEALSTELPPNTRVLSVPADVSAAIAGRVRAGDTVDIIAVVSRDGDSGGRMAVTLVQQALVLDTAPAESALQATARNSDEGGDTNAADTTSGHLPGIYSLALSPEQAQLVSLASATGQLYLSLTPVSGADVFDPTITTFDSLTTDAGNLTPLDAPGAGQDNEPADDAIVEDTDDE